MPRIAVSARSSFAVVLLLTFVAGCAGTVTVSSTSTAAAPGSSVPAASATVPMPSATLAGGGTSGAQPPITGQAVQGTEVAAAIRAAVGQARTVTLDLTSQAGSGSAAVDVARKAIRLQVGGDSGVSLVHVDGHTWVRGAGTVTVTAAATPTGTHSAAPRTSTRRWLLLGTDGTDVISRKLGSAASIEPLLRPIAFADLLDGLTGDRSPTEGGSRTLFRVPVDTYVRVVHGSPALAASLTRPVGLVVELDGSNRPVRVTATLTSDKATMADDTRYSGWDGPVDIQAPTADEVADAPGPDVAPEPTDAGTAQSPSKGAQPTVTVTVTATR